MPPRSLSAAAWPLVAGGGKGNVLNEHFPVVDPAAWANAAVVVAAIKQTDISRDRAVLWLLLLPLVLFEGVWLLIRLILRVVLGEHCRNEMSCCWIRVARVLLNSYLVSTRYLFG